MWKIEYYTGTEWIEKSDAVFKKIHQELNGHEECLFILPNTSSNRTFVSSDKKIRILYGSEAVFEGLLVGAEYNEDLLVCFAYPEAYVKMDSKIIPSSSSHQVEYVGETISNVLQAICDEAGVQKGECPSGTVSVRFVRSNCLKAAQFLADAVNKDFWADWDASLNPRFNIGTRQEHTNISVEPLEWPKRTVDRSQKITKVIIRSVDKDGNYIEGSAGTGDNIAVFTEKGAMDIDTLNTLAQKKLDELNTESSGVTLPLKVIQGYNLYPGDTVKLNKPELGWEGEVTYRVLAITKTIDKVKIEVEKKVKTVDQELNWFKKYEEYGIYLEATIIIEDELANRPPAGEKGRLFHATDTGEWYYDNGTAWELADTVYESTDVTVLSVSTGIVLVDTATGLTINVQGTGLTVNESATGITINGNTTGVSIYDASTGLSVDLSGTDISVSYSPTGITINGNTTGVSIQNASTGLSVQLSGTDISVSYSTTGITINTATTGLIINKRGTSVTVINNYTGESIQLSGTGITIQGTETGIVVTQATTGLTVISTSTGLTVVKNTSDVSVNSNTTGATALSGYMDRQYGYITGASNKHVGDTAPPTEICSGTVPTVSNAINLCLIRVRIYQGYSQPAGGWMNGSAYLYVGGALSQQFRFRIRDGKIEYWNHYVMLPENLSGKTIAVDAIADDGQWSYLGCDVYWYQFKKHSHAITGTSHAHGVTEPNSGQGHNHSVNDPSHSHSTNEGTGHSHPTDETAHSHGVTEPNAGQGHSHGIDDPGHGHSVNDPKHSHSTTDSGHYHGVNEGYGHQHGVYDPQHGHTVSDPGHVHSVTDSGHDHSITEPNAGSGHQHGVNDPQHDHPVSDPGHGHGVSDSGHTHTTTDTGHDHPVTDPQHSHSVSDPGHAHDVDDPGHSHSVDDPKHKHKVYSS